MIPFGYILFGGREKTPESNGERKEKKIRGARKGKQSKGLYHRRQSRDPFKTCTKTFTVKEITFLFNKGRLNLIIALTFRAYS